MPPPGSRRDPVPAAQGRVVMQRSGNACAYPGCGVALIAESLHPDDLDKPTGKIAHICAASPGGPRYDATMTTEQRGSAANLIYLCGDHHDAVDGQLNYHTVQFLRAAKAAHERAVARAVRHAMGEVTFEHLEVICSVLSAATVEPTSIDLPLPVEEKIRLNELGDESADKIKDGLAQQPRVQAFITFQTTMTPGLGPRLAARFKAEYYDGVANGLQGDDLFDRILATAEEAAGPVETPALRAAALAVVAYLFELCEIFEHEVAA